MVFTEHFLTKPLLGPFADRQTPIQKRQNDPQVRLVSLIWTLFSYVSDKMASYIGI